MKLSDEEKRAIEKVKEVIETDKQRRIETIYDEKPLFREQLQTLLDLIDKQQKEIKEGYHKSFIDGRISMKYEVQDKIKEKLNQINNEYSILLSNKSLSLEQQNKNAQRHEAMRVVLEELLEEK